MNDVRRLLTARRDAVVAKQDEGVTLIELLVVIFIIAVLAAIAIPIFLTQQQQAEEASVKADLASARTAYLSALEQAPTVVPDLDALQGNGYAGTSTGFFIDQGVTSGEFMLCLGTFSVTERGGVTGPAPAAHSATSCTR